MITSYW